MENGISKYWTPEADEHYKRLLAGCQTFAGRHLTMLFRDILKYDARSKEGLRAMAQSRLRLGTATDEDLRGLALLQTVLEEDTPGEIPGLHKASVEAERLAQLRAERDKIRQQGIKRSEIECR